MPKRSGIDGPHRNALVAARDHRARAARERRTRSLELGHAAPRRARGDVDDGGGGVQRVELGAARQPTGRARRAGRTSAPRPKCRGSRYSSTSGMPKRRANVDTDVVRDGRGARWRAPGRTRRRGPDRVPASAPAAPIGDARSGPAGSSTAAPGARAGRAPEPGATTGTSAGGATGAAPAGGARSAAGPFALEPTLAAAAPPAREPGVGRDGQHALAAGRARPGRRGATRSPVRGSRVTTSKRQPRAPSRAQPASASGSYRCGPRSRRRGRSAARVRPPRRAPNRRA